MNPVDIVQRQFEAYNARDIDRFCAQYAHDIEVFRPPSTHPAIVGATAFREFYATQRFNHAGLRAQLLGRLVIGRTVIDHERIHGVRDQPYEIAVVYEIDGVRIRRTWTHGA
jgi:hypothetical protein